MAQEEPDKASLKWIEEQEALMLEGEKLIADASNEALEYMYMAAENMNDREFRKMVMSTQPVEMGIGIGLAEHLIPKIYKDMEKSLHRRFKVPKKTAEALRHIFIGRVVKNIRKELDARSK